MKNTPGSEAIASGVVHRIPDDLTGTPVADTAALKLWEGLTPLARSEWICPVEDARKRETRQRRIERVRGDPVAGPDVRTAKEMGK